MNDAAENVLEVTDLRVWFPVRDGLLRRRVGYLRAVDDVSFVIKKGETLGLVGESGCGKTTTGRAILRLQRATAGAVTFDGHNVLTMPEREMRRMRARMQIVFQDPYSSLDPRMSVGASIAEGLRAQGLTRRKEVDEKVAESLSVVGLTREMRRRQPHELSGGQRQRVVIARALATGPEFVVCDEAVSALDVSVRAQIINLLQDLQEKFGLTYLFIAHDLAIVAHVSDRVAVMYLGKIVELAEADELYTSPRHPYTRALLSAIPDPDPRKPMARVMLRGEVPSALNRASGCAFRSRCPLAIERCSHEEPALLPDSHGRYVACHVTGETDGVVADGAA
jgi:oligopeptide/dipeptide ABC transporter ATP-binding protein